MVPIYAGVDLGGTNIDGALAGQDGVLLARKSIPTASHLGPTSVLDRVASLVETLSQEVGGRPAALGMGLPGLVDVQHGITRFLPNLATQWRDQPAAATLQARLNCPVMLLNDVRLATLGELTFGHGKTVRTMAFYALGTGVGGGVVVDGRLRLGPQGAAGELGHQTILPDGPICGCGNHGCLETLASGPAFIAQGVRLLRAGLAPRLHAIVEGDASRVTPREMVQAAREGDTYVHDALVQCATYLGIGVSNIVTALHPELIVLGGGVAGMGAILVDTVRRVVGDRVRMMSTDLVRIETSALGDSAGVLGGIALAFKGLPDG